MKFLEKHPCVLPSVTLVLMVILLYGGVRAVEMLR